MNPIDRERQGGWTVCRVRLAPGAHPRRSCSLLRRSTVGTILLQSELGYEGRCRKRNQCYNDADHG